MSFGLFKAAQRSENRAEDTMGRKGIWVLLYRGAGNIKSFLISALIV